MGRLQLRIHAIGLRIRLAWFKLINPAGHEEAERQADEGFHAAIVHLRREQEQARLRGETRLTDLQLSALKIANQLMAKTISDVAVHHALSKSIDSDSSLSMNAVKRTLKRLVELNILQELDSGFYLRLKSPIEELDIIEAEELRREKLVERLRNKIFHS